MEKWFVDLFDLLKKQKEPARAKLLLPEIYSEFDILTRANKTDDLKDIYEYISNNNPVQTEDKKYNEEAYNKCKQQILKNLILLDDFSLIDTEVNELLSNKDKKGLDKLLNLWMDNRFVYEYINKIIDKENKPKTQPPIQKEIVPKPIKRDKQPEKVVVKEVIEPKKEIIKEETKATKKIVEVPKQEKSVIEDKPKQEKPIIVRTSKETQPYFDALNFLSMRYNLIYSENKLRNTTNPIQNILILVQEFIDENEPNAAFFIDFFTVLSKFNLNDFITYIANRSLKFIKLATLNIGLVNEFDLEAKYKLLEILKDSDLGYVNLSILEKELRVYIDSLNFVDTTIKEIYSLGQKASYRAPLCVETYEAAKAIDFFKKHIYSKRTHIVKQDNLTHLYWAMVLSAIVGIYVERKQSSDYVECMNCVADMAIKLIPEIKPSNIQSIIKALASSYIRRIYISGIQSNNYDNWWRNNRQELIEAKFNELAKINEA